jgi:hypothetical protein
LVEFEGNYRAASDPRFAELLARVRLGEHTKDDIALLKTRCPPSKWSAETVSRLLKAGAPKLRFRREKVDKANQEALKDTQIADNIKLTNVQQKTAMRKQGCFQASTTHMPSPKIQVD